MEHSLKNLRVDLKHLNMHKQRRKDLIFAAGSATEGSAAAGSYRSLLRIISHSHGQEKLFF
jgi:hypothetical protein